ncbi:MAG: ornithine carbamoyltransferase [Phycisphaerales bacterium]
MNAPMVLAKPRHMLAADDLSPSEFACVIDAAIKTKKNQLETQPLAGQSVAMMFEKPSLRTRVSFEAGLHTLGAHPIYLDQSTSRIGERESIPDLAAYLSRSVRLVIARVHSHEALVELASHSSIPVINALSDEEHPCQALADLLTMKEHVGNLAGKAVAFIGDGNNVCHSLMIGCALTGANLKVVTPIGREPRQEYCNRFREIASETGAALHVGHEPDLLRGCDIVYTDTWVSMGQDESSESLGVFEKYRVTAELMDLASDGSGQWPLFLHCMPAKRGVEVEAAVIDGATSIVYDQAENRMHAQNALMRFLLNPTEESWLRK